MAKKGLKQPKIRPTIIGAKKKKRPTPIGMAIRGLGGMAGTSLGSMIGYPAAGGSLGTTLGAALSKWLGAGDYRVQSNSLLARSTAGIPAMHSSNQSVVIRHREFLCEVTSSQTFTVKRSFPLNPGLVQTFPWLSNIASRFQEYTIKGLVFHYIPSSGSAVSSTNNALGTVMLQTTYRANDTPPASKVEMLNEYWSSEAMPSESFVHPIECSPAETPFKIHYVRSDPVPTGDTPLMYDLGVTTLAVSGMQAAGITLGDLWVSYEVELKKPIIESNVTSSSAWNAYYSVNTPSTPIFGTGTATSGNVPLRFSGYVITIPIGYSGRFTFAVSVFFSGTTTSYTLAGSAAGVNCSVIAVNDANGSIGYDVNSANGGASTTFTYLCRVSKINRDVDATVTIPSISIGTGTLTTVLVTMFGTHE